jgi:hypothetical protein
VVSLAMAVLVQPTACWRGSLAMMVWARGHVCALGLAALVALQCCLSACACTAPWMQADCIAYAR